MIKKLIDDTLKTPKGKFSRTSLTMFTCLFAALSYLGYETIKNNTFHIEAFFFLLSVAVGLKGIDVIDKHKTKNAEVENQ
jgi:hypothetical protein